MSDSPAPDPITPAAASAAAGGFRTHHRDEVASTSDWAHELVDAGELVPPAVLVADEQTAGRGRRGRGWDAGPPGGPTGVTATFAVASLPVPANHLPLIAAVLLREAVASAAPRVRVKWPNDLVVGNRKLAGLLCERRGGLDLVGVGLNVRPPGVAGAVGLDEVARDPVGRPAAFGTVCRGMAGLLRRRPTTLADVLGDYRDALAWVGRVVLIRDGGVSTLGTLRGVDDEGRLLVGSTVHVTGTLRLA